MVCQRKELKRRWTVTWGRRGRTPLVHFGGDPESYVYPEDYADCDGNFILESVCGEGTVWYESLQHCVPEAISAACYFGRERFRTGGHARLD